MAWLSKVLAGPPDPGNPAGRARAMVRRITPCRRLCAGATCPMSYSPALPVRCTTLLFGGTYLLESAVDLCAVATVPVRTGCAGLDVIAAC